MRHRTGKNKTIQITIRQGENVFSIFLLSEKSMKFQQT